MATPGYTIAELPMEEISMGHSRADRAAIDSAVQKGQRPPGMARTRTPALDRISASMQARNAPKPPASKIGSFVKGGAALAAASSIADSAQADSTDRYAKRFGVAAPTGDGSIPDIAKFAALRAGGFASDLGNNLTMGAAGNLYRDKPNGLLQFSQPTQAAQPAVAAQPAQQPAAGQTAQPAAAPVAQAGQPPVPGALGMPTIGKVNVSRQPNGVMSFTGKDQVDGYAGPAAGQLKGGGYSGAVSPADYQAAVARGAADKAGVVSMAASKAAQGDMDGAYRLAAGDPAATAAVEQALQQKAMQQAVLNGNSGAASVLNQQGANEVNKLRIAADIAPKPDSAYDQERTRGAKMENDRAAIVDGLLSEFMGAKDDKTRESALAKLNAINGKNAGADKYIMGEVESGVDALGNPIMRKTPFNTRTGQYVGMEGGAPAAANDDNIQEGDYLRGSDGKAYRRVNGQNVLVQ